MHDLLNYNASKVSVVLVVLRNNDLVSWHSSAASAQALIHVVVLLIPWYTRLTSGEICKDIRTLLKNLFAGLIIVIFYRTFLLIIDLNTIVWKRSYASGNVWLNLTYSNAVM